MGLQSALTTALTGLQAAETTIDVVGNNVANSQTVGFKESEAIFATQFSAIAQHRFGAQHKLGWYQPATNWPGCEGRGDLAKLHARHNRNQLQPARRGHPRRRFLGCAVW